MKRSDYAPYLRTLRRIPAEVRQSMATRDFGDMGNPWTCVCGWAIRDALVAATGAEPSACDVRQKCAELFGGDAWDEWDRIFSGVCYTDSLEHIEVAFTIAVAETVRI